MAGIIEAFKQFSSVTADVSKGKKVPFVDMQMLLPKSTDFFGDNVHYTDEGAFLFASNVSKTIGTLPTH